MPFLALFVVVIDKRARFEKGVTGLAIIFMERMCLVKVLSILGSHLVGVKVVVRNPGAAVKESRVLHEPRHSAQHPFCCPCKLDPFFLFLLILKLFNVSHAQIRRWLFLGRLIRNTRCSCPFVI